MAGGRVGIIPAAGYGSRFGSVLKHDHKSLLKIGGIKNIDRIINVMLRDLSVEKIIIVVGHNAGKIRAEDFPGKYPQVPIELVDNPAVEKGLIHSVMLGAERAGQDVCIMLSDEFYLGANHADLKSLPMDDCLGYCCGIRTDDIDAIRSNYSIQNDDARVVHLIEKPRVVQSDLMGVGTFLLRKDVFPLMREVLGREPGLDFITCLDRVAQLQPLRLFQLTGSYVNINTKFAYFSAKFAEREASFTGATIALLIYLENPADTNLLYTVKRYAGHPAIHRIYCTLDDSPAGDALAARLSALGLGVETLRMSASDDEAGEKIKQALRRIPESIVILSDAEYSFPRKDIDKILVYIKDCDFVTGTRTTRSLMGDGARLGFAARMAHILLGKLVEVLWWGKEPRLTDTGCLFRAFWRDEADEFIDELTGGTGFLADMLITAIDRDKRVLEIPVTYYNRNEALRNKYQHIGTFLSFLYFIVRRRFRHVPGESP